MSSKIKCHIKTVKLHSYYKQHAVTKWHNLISMESWRFPEKQATVTVDNRMLACPVARQSLDVSFLCEWRDFQEEQPIGVKSVECTWSVTTSCSGVSRQDGVNFSSQQLSCNLWYTVSLFILGYSLCWLGLNGFMNPDKPPLEPLPQINIATMAKSTLFFRSSLKLSILCTNS